LGVDVAPGADVRFDRRSISAFAAAAIRLSRRAGLDSAQSLC